VSAAFELAERTGAGGMPVSPAFASAALLQDAGRSVYMAAHDMRALIELGEVVDAARQAEALLSEAQRIIAEALEAVRVRRLGWKPVQR
jgi:hypothetical protein